jgi:hypothetical protein
MKSRIMYIECKAGGLSGSGRIGRVSFSKTGKTLYYAGRKFETLSGRGFKENYFDVKSDTSYWISGCKKRGRDRLYPGLIRIDDDVREEYWSVVRGKPEHSAEKVIRCGGKYGG